MAAISVTSFWSWRSNSAAGVRPARRLADRGGVGAVVEGGEEIEHVEARDLQRPAAGLGRREVGRVGVVEVVLPVLGRAHPPVAPKRLQVEHAREPGDGVAHRGGGGGAEGVEAVEVADRLVLGVEAVVVDDAAPAGRLQEAGVARDARGVGLGESAAAGRPRRGGISLKRSRLNISVMVSVSVSSTRMPSKASRSGMKSPSAFTTVASSSVRSIPAAVGQRVARRISTATAVTEVSSVSPENSSTVPVTVTTSPSFTSTPRLPSKTKSPSEVAASPSASPSSSWR